MIGYAAPPKPSGGGLTSMLAGILALVAAGVVVGASFAPITSLRNSFESDGAPFVDDSKTTWWGTSYDGSTDPIDAQSSLVGLSLVLVAALLVLGAVFAFVASRTRMSGPTSGGRSLISAGVGVLTGVLVLQVMEVVEQASRFNDRDLEPGESLDYTPGLGLILPLCALGLGLVAVVLAHVGQRARAARVEPNTPRMGFPAPYGYRQGPGAPGAPVAERPTDVEAGSSAASLEEIDDAADTQVVSNETVSDAVSAGQSSEQATPAEPPASPAPEAPTGFERPAPMTDSEPAASPAPAAPAEAAPVTPAPAATSDTADAPSATPNSNSEPAATPTGDAPAAPSEAKPTSLTDLPAAPPAPELSDEKKADK